jgi:hypothetical protein
VIKHWHLIQYELKLQRPAAMKGRCEAQATSIEFVANRATLYRCLCAHEFAIGAAIRNKSRSISTRVKGRRTLSRGALGGAFWRGSGWSSFGLDGKALQTAVDSLPVATTAGGGSSSPLHHSGVMQADLGDLHAAAR